MNPNRANRIPTSSSSGDAGGAFDIGFTPNGDAPRFNELFEDEPEVAPTTDLSIKRFKKYENLQEAPKSYFASPDFYKVLLSGEGDISKRIHGLLQEFLKATDAQDKSMYRSRLAPAFWELYGTVATKVGSRLPDPKMLLLRYAVLLPTAIDPDQRQLISSIPQKNDSGEPVFYVDEWIKEVATGRVSSSAVDETKSPRGNEQAKFNASMDKARGRYDAQRQLITGIANEMVDYERMLIEHAQNVVKHDTMADFDGAIAPYNETQRASFTEIGEMMRRLSNSNRRLQQAYSEMTTINEQLESLKQRAQEEGGIASDVDTKAIEAEIGTIRQMAKMCVGRQGNHFPMLMKTYWRGSIRDIGTRENLINIMADLEYLDEGLFLRTFKQQTNRIVPNIILIPCYGDYGTCWEPFERHNRATSRGRIAIPMYPKDLRTAVIAAMADLRWQVAKEKAQHYWMEEGLTGWYYQWFAEQKLKGDVKDQFILDYILWLTKESEGTQKLPKEVREIFWRYIPYPADLKEKLKLRGFVYQELCKKDLNRSMSDGY